MSDSQSQAISLIHDALHKGDVQLAHELCHRALGIEGDEIDPNGPRFFRGFDSAFLTACRKNNVPAAYVIFDQHHPGHPRHVRVLTGGNVWALNLLKRILAAGQHAVAADAPPAQKEAPSG